MPQTDHIQENRAFAEMMKAARAWLSGKNPAEIAEKAGIAYDAETMRFRLTAWAKKRPFPIRITGWSRR